MPKDVEEGDIVTDADGKRFKVIKPGTVDDTFAVESRAKTRESKTEIPAPLTLEQTMQKGVRGQAAIAKEVKRRLKKSVNEMLDRSGETPYRSTSFSRQGGTLQVPVQATSGWEDAPAWLKRGALPVGLGVGGGLVLGKIGEVVGSTIGEYANQKLGVTPESMPDLVAAGGMPLLFRGGKELIKDITRGVSGFVAPSATREAGVQVIEAQFGRRGANLYGLLKKQPPILSDTVSKVIKEAIAEETATATPRRVAVKTLMDLVKWVGKQEEIPHAQMVKEVQRLRHMAKSHFAKGDHTTGTTLNQAATKIIDSLDEVSPLLKQANMAYRRQQAMDEITTQMRKLDAAVAAREVFKDPLIKGAFTRSEREEIIRVSDTISRITLSGTGGAANRFIMMVAEPLADLMSSNKGRRLLENLLMRPNMNASRFAGGVGQIANQMRHSNALKDAQTPEETKKASQEIQQDPNQGLSDKLEASTKTP
jgi:hypothetical protein